MKKLFFTLLMLVPMTLWAQDNTWERPEVDEQAEAAKAKENPDAKYLKGAVPEVNGKVVFTKHINAPGKSATQIYRFFFLFKKSKFPITEQRVLLAKL